MLTAVLSFFGVIIGASLQFLFTRHMEGQRHLRELRSKAYMDYLKCVCEQAQFRFKEENKEKQELFSRIADAKARICLYGSKEAIQAFSQFEKLGASMGSIEQRTAFTSMVSIMRADSGGEIGTDPEDIQIVLLGIRD